jgi:glucokinase
VTAVATANRSFHLGLDLGATNVKWAVVERVDDAWAVADRGQVATNAPFGAAAVLERMADLGNRAITDQPGIATVGIGLPGLFDADMGIATFLPNLPPDWEGRDVVGPIQARLGLPVTLINDARAFGLAELRLGAARGCGTMVGLALGTGVGGVIAVGGEIHFGHAGTGGEVGHQTLLPDGPPCTCGNRGCLEAFTRADAVAAACGTATAEEGVTAALAGDAAALSGIGEVGRWLGIGIANLIVVLTPDRVVIGGGVAGAGDLLLDPIRAEVRSRVRVTDLDAVEIVTAELGTWAGAIGAAVHGAAAPVAESVTR